MIWISPEESNSFKTAISTSLYLPVTMWLRRLFIPSGDSIQEKKLCASCLIVVIWVSFLATIIIYSKVLDGSCFKDSLIPLKTFKATSFTFKPISPVPNNGITIRLNFCFSAITMTD